MARPKTTAKIKPADEPVTTTTGRLPQGQPNIANIPVRSTLTFHQSTREFDDKINARNDRATSAIAELLQF